MDKLKAAAQALIARIEKLGHDANRAVIEDLKSLADDLKKTLTEEAEEEV